MADDRWWMVERKATSHMSAVSRLTIASLTAVWYKFYTAISCLIKSFLQQESPTPVL